MNKIKNKEAKVFKTIQEVIESYEVAKPFKELLERNAAHQQNNNQSIDIYFGQKNDELNEFQCYLHTNFTNPLVHILFHDNEPQLKISSFDKENGGSVTLNLDLMKDIEIKEYRVGDDFLNYDISFYYIPANMDYNIHVVVR